MRKRIIPSDQPVPADVWMNPDSVARVEVSSEEPEHPVEAALLPGTGWRASRPGPQTIRLVFNGPQHIRRIRLRFVADAHTRTQEFVLRWVNASSEPREIVRQQWNFSGSTEEVEDYRVDLPGVIELELVVIPDISGGSAHASLAEMRVA
ncbi:carbohydrate-binding protein [Fimbriiglobus ruber]|uniref:carbohydrate-binding protein n=1 Tax=Fimbriiglobus ruber TaxID=1908690 RepID=UPI000B4A90D9|nr:carbohydrate-binding protein [Fimbriiglobus ruber]